MKVIGISNFDNESVDDILICETINEYYGNKVKDLLINDMSEHDKYYYKLVKDDYKLYEFQP